MTVRPIRFVCAILFLMVLSSCRDGKLASTLSVVSGSENEALKPLIDEFCRLNDVEIKVSYQGSVDIMNLLSDSVVEADAIWPANSIWISLGDRRFQVKDQKSIMISPVVFAVRESLATRLGLTGDTVKVEQILSAIESKKLTFAMTSATQSNSGAIAYLGFLHALSRSPEVLSMEDLDKPLLREQARKLLGGVSRSAASSGWLKDLFLKGGFDAMVNYESLVIEANQELVRTGREPLRVIYPADGLAIADSPLGFVDHGDPRKEALFKKFQGWLLSPEIQARLAGIGRRPGQVTTVFSPDPAVFKAEWGIQSGRTLSPAPLPSADVIRKALNLYQTDLRKPSATVYALDFSGSMDGAGHSQLMNAMSMLLTPSASRKVMLQPGPRDRSIVIAFSDRPLATWSATGSDSATFDTLLQRLTQLQPQGGTDIYTPLMQGLDSLMTLPPGEYTPMVILMTDGESNTGDSFEGLQRKWGLIHRTIPIFPIMFGEASNEQLDRVSELTTAQTLDGRTNLVGAFRKARGNN